MAEHTLIGKIIDASRRWNGNVKIIATVNDGPLAIPRRVEIRIHRWMRDGLLNKFTQHNPKAPKHLLEKAKYENLKGKNIRIQISN